MNLSKDKRKLDVGTIERDADKALEEFRSAKAGANTRAAATTKAITVASFASLYKKSVRPAMLLGASLLKLIRRSDSANGVMQAVAFLDLFVGGGIPTE